MLNLTMFFEELQKKGVTFFTGVPDSYLNGFCNHLLLHVEPKCNVIAANEGNAIGIAAGYYFATKSLPLVYMQNSGLGNTINPLVSLVDENVYSVPMLLLIGWRGQPGTKDWAQHKLQGEITTKMLDIMNISYKIVEEDDECIENVVSWAVNEALQNKKPVALIGKKGVFSGEKVPNSDASYELSREEAIETILDVMPKDTVYSVTTGRANRELYFLRERRNEGHQNDFLNVGSMGHASSVALGMALSAPAKRIVCLDGDAAAIMHMGALTMVSKLDVPNFLHIVLNNGAHESVGGQPSVGHLIDFIGIAESSGYRTIDKPVTNKEELVHALEELQESDRAAFLEIRIHKGMVGDLPPLRISHEGLIKDFMEELHTIM